MEILCANVETLKGELEAVARELRDEQRKQRDALASERTDRERTVCELRDRLESLAVGKLPVEWAGVWYLVVGVILATIPGEVVAFLDWL